MKKFTIHLKKWVFFSVCLCFCLFTGFNVPEKQGVDIQDFLIKYYDTDALGKEIKRYEINVTNTGFCRYRKVFINGKEEYYAFNLSRFKSMDFYGTNLKGDLYLRTKNDDVVVQTRNDRKGEIDSTGTYVVIPLKNVDEVQLNELALHFKQVTAAINK